MSHAHAALPRQSLDAKRILATSGAIAIHVAILMMLMMPAQVATPEPEAQVIGIEFQEPRPLPPPPPPPKPEELPKPKPIHQQVAPIVPIVEPVVDPVDQTQSVVDIAVPEITDEATSFDPGPATAVFQQLATRFAPPPPYPRSALQRGFEGTVLLRIRVDAGGNPVEVSVEKSSGFRILDEAALKAVKARWKFVPAQSNGQAIEGWALVPVEFVID